MRGVYNAVPYWAGVALVMPHRTAPHGRFLVTMQMVPIDGTYTIEEEHYPDISSYDEPTRYRVGSQQVSISLRGRLVGPDHWDRWRPDQYGPPPGELPGRPALPPGGHRELGR